MSVRTSQSRLKTYRACERKYVYRYDLGLTLPGPTGGNRLLGSWVHAALAVRNVRKGLDRESLVELPRGLRIIDGLRVDVLSDVGAIEVVESPDLPRTDLASRRYDLTWQGAVSLATDWWKALPSGDRDRLEATCDGPIPPRLENLISRYLWRWREGEGHDHDGDEAPLLVEAGWSRTIPGTDVEVAGGVDLVYRNTRQGVVIVRDYKTEGRLRGGGNLLYDPQLNIYAWGISPRVPGSITVIEQDRIERDPPTDPKLTKKTKRFSKTVTRFDLPTYLDFCERTGFQPKDKHVESLKTREELNLFWRRHRMPVSINIVREHLRAAVRDAPRAADLTLETALRTLSRSCNYCDYQSLCMAQLQTGDDDLEHYNLAEHNLTGPA